MAKKKSAAESRNANVATRSPAKKSAASTAVLSDDQIGAIAGRVWHELTSGPQTVTALKKSVDAPGDVVLAAIGWLAREGKLAFDSNGRSVKLSLR